MPLAPVCSLRELRADLAFRRSVAVVRKVRSCCCEWRAIFSEPVRCFRRCQDAYGRLNAAEGDRSGPPCLQLQQTTRKGRTMGFFSKDIKTMDDLFVHTLRDIYYAENQILKALPEMIEKATDPQLKQAFQMHLGETKNHVTRVEQVFKMHGVEAKGVDCPAIDGIIEEADDIAGEVQDKEVLNAALVAAAQAVEHYEITRYGTLVAWAKQLGRSDCASVLQKNLDEEKAADKKLTQIAEAKLNLKAAS
jgi:ferritin-like metal-binding protein YciE